MATLTPDILDFGTSLKAGGTEVIDSTGDVNTTDVDTPTAATLALGGTTATAVDIGRTGQATTVLGSMTVTQAATFTAVADFDAGITLAAGQSIEGDGALSVDGTGAFTLGGTNATSVTVGRTGITTTIAGDFVVQGENFSTSATNVLYSDNHLYLNQGYETVAAQTGGFVVNYLPIATTDTANGAIVAGIAATSNPTMVTTGSATFAVGQFIQVSSAGDVANDGIYEVLTHVGTTLTIRGVGTTATVEDFTQNQFTADASDTTATLTRVTLAILRAGTDGVFEAASGATTGLTFSDLTTGAGDLQAAYDAQAGATVTGSLTLDFDTTGAIKFDSTVSIGIGSDSDTSQIDIGSAGARKVQLGSLTATELGLDADFWDAHAGSTGMFLDSAGVIKLTAQNSGASALELTVTSTTGSIDLNAGTASGAFTLNGGGACTITMAGINLAAGSSEIDLTTTGALDLNSAAGTWDSSAGIAIEAATASSFNVTTGALTLSTTTSGDLTLSTTTAGDIILSGAAAVTINATTITFAGTSGTLTLGRTGLEASIPGSVKVGTSGTAGTITNEGAAGELTAVKYATTELTGLTGATATAASLIPAGSMVLGVATRVTTLVTGATSFDIGDGTDIDRWGATSAVALNSTTDPTDFTDNTISWQTSVAGDVVLTANGSNFLAGAVRITVAYISYSAPTS